MTYIGFGPEYGRSVRQDEAVEYALWRITTGDEKLQAEFVEWFYSGNWIAEETPERGEQSA